jgi:hypothetical protein
VTSAKNLINDEQSLMLSSRLRWGDSGLTSAGFTILFGPVMLSLPGWSPKMTKRCKFGKVIFETELDAKIALASRKARDKGEIRYYPCNAHGVKKHWHLTSQERDAA